MNTPYPRTLLVPATTPIYDALIAERNGRSPGTPPPPSATPEPASAPQSAPEATDEAEPTGDAEQAPNAA